MIVQELANFRLNLRAVMAAKSISQRTLAERIESGHTHVNRILQGKSDPSLPMCGKIADAVGCSLRDMLLAPAAFEATLTVPAA